jgi:hypothetical protein
MDISVRISPNVVLTTVIVLIIVCMILASAPQSAAWLLPCFVLGSFCLTGRQDSRLP